MTRRRRAALLTLLLAIATSACSGADRPAGVELRAASVVDRIAGADRYESAAAVARAVIDDGAGGAVYVASGARYSDALTAGAWAGRAGTAVLLVERDAIPMATSRELERIQPDAVTVVGGTASVSDAVLDALRAATGATVSRLAGADRYGTAAMVAGSGPGGDVAYIATGEAFPDALAASAAAGAADAALLLVRRDEVPAETDRTLRELDPREIVIVGSTGAVSASVERALRPRADTVRRVGGVDRYATAALLAPPESETAFVATGDRFPDALAIAPLAASGNAPVLLARQHCVPSVVLEHLSRAGVTRVVLAGGTAALHDDVAALRPCADPLVGTNYTHHTIEQCGFQGTGILATYHEEGVRARVREQLATMRSAGVESLRLIVWHEHDPGTRTYGVVASDGGVLREPHRANLVAYLRDVSDAGFLRLTVSFAPKRSNDPGDSLWAPEMADENQRFIADVRTLAHEHGPVSVHVDLMNEGAPSPTAASAAVARVQSYLAETYRTYVDAFGIDDVTVSAIANQGDGDNAARLGNLISALQASGRRLPNRYEVHIGYDRASAARNLRGTDQVLDDHGIDAPLVIGETAYDDSGVAAAIAQFLRDGDRDVAEVLQWPQTAEKPCPHFSVTPPYEVDAYLEALR